MTNNQRPARGISPASKAQVSGYKFLQRRAELGLLLGDVRMLHDPIAKLRRGLLFGLSAAVLLGVGSGALAVFSPAADPGDAPIMRSDSGDLFVRVDQQIHPVANLASARLVAGEPAQPVKASDSVLAREHIGVPIGIPDAPRIVPEKSQEQPAWHVVPLGRYRGSNTSTRSTSAGFSCSSGQYCTCRGDTVCGIPHCGFDTLPAASGGLTRRT